MDDLDITPLVVVALLLVGYVIPTIVAFHRRHPNRWPIFIVNMVFGATFIGWVASLVWALHAVHQPDERGGGESGLNIFATYPSRFSVHQATNTPPAALDTQMIIGQLERLNSLLCDGSISPSEYAKLKSALLANI